MQHLGRRAVLVRQTTPRLVAADDEPDAGQCRGWTGRCRARNTSASVRASSASEEPDRGAAALLPVSHAGGLGPEDVVVDLTPFAGALTRVLLRAASSLLIPVRSSVLEIAAAARCFTRLQAIQRLAGTQVPVLLALLTPEDERERQVARLAQVMADHDPGYGLWHGTPTGLLAVPFLTEDRLLTLYEGEQLWDATGLAEACKVMADILVRQLAAHQPATLAEPRATEETP